MEAFRVRTIVAVVLVAYMAEETPLHAAHEFFTSRAHGSKRSIGGWWCFGPTVTALCAFRWQPRAFSWDLEYNIGTVILELELSKADGHSTCYAFSATWTALPWWHQFTLNIICETSENSCMHPCANSTRRAVLEQWLYWLWTYICSAGKE